MRVSLVHVILLQDGRLPEDRARWPRLQGSCLHGVHAPEQSRQAKQERWRLGRFCLALAPAAAMNEPSCCLMSSSPSLKMRFCASPLSNKAGTQGFLRAHLDRSRKLLTTRVPPSHPIPYLNSSMFFYHLLLFFQQYM